MEGPRSASAVHITRSLFTRLPAVTATTSLSDPARQQELIDEQAQHVALLHTTGGRPFNLPTAWLDRFAIVEDEPNGDDDDGHAGDDMGDEGGEERHSDHESSDEEDLRERQSGRLPGAAPQRGPARDNSEGVRGDKGPGMGAFSFFLATAAPFLCGKIDDERIDENGEREVCVHWYTPSDSLVASAGSGNFDKYGRAVFRPTFKVVRTQAAQGRRQRTTYTPDNGWEPASRIAASCRFLTGKNKHIPAVVLHTLRTAKGLGQQARPLGARK
ncbi:unnamed protein product [Pylaiella littoralis]